MNVTMVPGAAWPCRNTASANIVMCGNTALCRLIHDPASSSDRPEDAHCSNLVNCKTCLAGHACAHMKAKQQPAEWRVGLLRAIRPKGTLKGYYDRPIEHFVTSDEQRCYLAKTPVHGHSFRVKLLVVTGGLFPPSRAVPAVFMFEVARMKTLLPPTPALIGNVVYNAIRRTYSPSCRRLVNILSAGLKRAKDERVVHRGRRIVRHTPLSRLVPDKCSFWSPRGHRHAPGSTRQAVVTIARVAQRLGTQNTLPYMPQEMWRLVLNFLPADYPLYTFVLGKDIDLARDYDATFKQVSWP